MLSHSGPLGLAHRLLNVEPLPFGSISTNNHELMQLKTVQEGHPRLRMPTFGHLTVHCSPRVTLMHLAADTIPLGLCVARQQVPQLLIRLGNCLVVSLLGFLEHLASLLNLHLAGRNIHRCQDGVPRLRGFLENLQPLRPSCNSLGENSALLGQPLLFNHSEDCNFVRKVFLIVPTGVNRHAEVGRIGKLDLEDLRIFLGRDNVYHGDVRDRWLMRQLPLLALSILQPVWGLEGGTHFWHDARVQYPAGVS
jgi:hypothetical protein